MVYSIPCKTCDLKYIGTTKQKLKNRISAHKSTIRTNKAESTALAEHDLRLGHEMDFQETSILYKGKIKNKQRKIFF